MKGGPKSSLRPFLHRALQLLAPGVRLVDFSSPDHGLLLELR